MTGSRPSIVPLMAMVVVYMLVAAAATSYLVTGVMFGSEIYRERGIPLAEWAGMAWPLVGTIALLSGTILFWNNGRQAIAYALFCAMLIVVLAVFSLNELPTI